MYTSEALKLSVIRARIGARGRASWSNGSAISWGRPEAGLVRLAWARDRETFSQDLALDATTGRGATTGERLWWLCPDCGERRAYLFLRWDRFACRACQGLKYRTQSMGALDRAYRQQRAVARRINPEADALDYPERPEGMQRRTFARLQDAWWKAHAERQEIIGRELVGIARRYFSSQGAELEG